MHCFLHRWTGNTSLWCINSMHSHRSRLILLTEHRVYGSIWILLIRMYAEPYSSTQNTGNDLIHVLLHLCQLQALYNQVQTERWWTCLIPYTRPKICRFAARTSASSNYKLAARSAATWSLTKTLDTDMAHKLPILARKLISQILALSLFIGLDKS